MTHQKTEDMQSNLAMHVLDATDPNLPLSRRLPARFNALDPRYRKLLTPQARAAVNAADPDLVRQVRLSGGRVPVGVVEYFVDADGRLRVGLPTAGPGPGQGGGA